MKKSIPAGYRYSFVSQWNVYGKPKTVNLNQKKGKHTATIKKTDTYIGPHKISLSVDVASRYGERKVIKTFYKLPKDKVTTHTMSKAETIASHVTIAGGIATLKLAKVGSKTNPVGLFLNLSSYGLGANYSLKSLNVIQKGYPTPAVGQYSRITTTYKKDKIFINIKVWPNKESYKKGVKPSYNKTQTNTWGKY